jgi:hypothetical protein
MVINSIPLAGLFSISLASSFELTNSRLRSKAPRKEKQSSRTKKQLGKLPALGNHTIRRNSRDGEGVRNQRTSRLSYHGKVQLPGWKLYPCSWGQQPRPPQPSTWASRPRPENGKPMTRGDSPRQPQARTSLAGVAATHHDSSPMLIPTRWPLGAELLDCCWRSAVGATCCPGPGHARASTGMPRGSRTRDEQTDSTRAASEILLPSDRRQQHPAS